MYYFFPKHITYMELGFNKVDHLTFSCYLHLFHATKQSIRKNDYEKNSHFI